MGFEAEGIYVFKVEPLMEDTELSKKRVQVLKALFELLSAARLD